MEEEDKASCSALGIDQACVYVDTAVQGTFSWQFDECVGCPFANHNKFDNSTTDGFVIGTEYPASFLVEVGKEQCVLHQHLQEHGMYNLHVALSDFNCSANAKDSCISCKLTEGSATSPITTYTPIIVAVCIYIGIAVIFIIGEKLYSTFIKDRENDSFANVNSPCASSTTNLNHGSSTYSSSATVEVIPPPQTRKRLRSLDTFRGISLAIMIFVNYGGGKYWFFHHARWNGLTVADLVFPWFIWIMGVSMTMSLRSLIKKSTPKLRITWKIWKRTVILFVLGIILNTSYGANDMTQLRVPGVLQRFAVSYFVVGIVHMFFARPADSHTERRWSAVRDIALYWVEWLIMLSLLLMYLCLTFLLPVPGCPTGYLGPGGLHDNGAHWNCTGGAAGYIDRAFFGPQHIYNHPTCKPMYKTSEPYDPEGLLGCLTSIFLVFLGLQAGKILQTYSSDKQRIYRWLAWGVATGVIAAILCKGGKNDGWIPVNKNLWSLSFILTTGCMGFFLLSFCYFIQDVRGWWSGSPFFYPGMNSILVYVGHQLTSELFPWQFKAANTHGAELAMDLWGTSLWVFIAYVLYRKKVFLAI